MRARNILRMSCKLFGIYPTSQCIAILSSCDMFVLRPSAIGLGRRSVAFGPSQRQEGCLITDTTMKKPTYLGHGATAQDTSTEAHATRLAIAHVPGSWNRGFNSQGHTCAKIQPCKHSSPSHHAFSESAPILHRD